MVAGVVEGTLHLVADPMESAAGSDVAYALAADCRQPPGHGGPSTSDSTAVEASAAGGNAAAGMAGSDGSGVGGGGDKTTIAAAFAAARFVEVYSSRTGAASQGPSGIRML